MPQLAGFSQAAHVDADNETSDGCFTPRQGKESRNLTLTIIRSEPMIEGF